MKVSKEQARQFLVNHQHLSGKLLCGKDGILQYFKKAGCIQYDPLNVVGRNTDLVLQSRIPDYTPQMLESLLYEERKLMDGWDKVMSIILVEDWQYFHLAREVRGKEVIATLQHRQSSHALEYIDEVLEAVTKNGAMQPKQIGEGMAGNTSWGHRNIYNATMDYLFHIGKLGVSKKIGVTKVFDLIENIIPTYITQTSAAFTSEHDFFKWYVYRRIASVGMLWNRNGGGWYGTLIPDKITRQKIFDELVAEGVVTIIEVEGITEKFYAKTVDVENSLGTESENQFVKFIAPLDNLIWDRDMVSKIFDFDYTWEVYVPSAKRKYGYYVLPVLYGNRLIARFEPEKNATHFCIKNWWWEQDVVVTNELTECVEDATEKFAAFLGKEQGVHENVYRTMS